MLHVLPQPGRYTCPPPALALTPIPPAHAGQDEAGIWRLDFGRAWFGTLALEAKVQQPVTLQIHLGEKLTDETRYALNPLARRIDRTPPGTVRYRRAELRLQPGRHRYQVTIPPDERNTGRAAIHMPPEIGEVMPFRYVEIEAQRAGEAQNVQIHPGSFRLIAAHAPFDPEASHFHCSDPTLNAVWTLCRHTIHATTFCGLYVDGDRERISYEGDAYINQLSHYACDWNPGFARYTLEYLIQHPTWFSDWLLHAIFMAWADYLYTGETDSIAAFYDDLAAKTLIDLAREDGLISMDHAGYTPELEKRLHLHHPRYLTEARPQDLVDWPPGSFTQDGTGERDGHQMLPINTVVNALHAQALKRMSRLASAIGRHADAARFAQQARRVTDAINAHLFDAQAGLYRDGLSAENRRSEHASLHANLFPLAFGLVPPQHRKSVVAFVRSRGMACSVYGAQYLLEGLYDAGEAEHALDLMCSRSNRSWLAMIEAGSTMTMEAWGHRYKNNLDWNHAWGTAPANILPRKLMGIEPATPGWKRTTVRPQPGSLSEAKLTIPTPFGPIHAAYEGGARPTFEVQAPREIELVPMQPPQGTAPRFVLNGRVFSL